MRPIDADVLKEWFVAQIDHYKKYSGDNCNAMVSAYEAVLERIDNEPTMGAVPVCRCCDCKYCYKESDYEYWCGGNGFPMRLVTAEDYCSRGKRKEITL